MANHEIGSEFWDVPTREEPNHLFPINASWYVSGRSALSAVIEDARLSRRVRSAALPSWCCESMVEPFVAAGIDVEFYHVGLGREGVRQTLGDVPDCDLLLVMGYFGFDGAPEAPEGFVGVVVEDLTHSLLSDHRASRADYRFGSLRKWCGVWTGGFAWRCDGEALQGPALPCDTAYVEARRRAMREKAAYIDSGEGGKRYLAAFAEAEEWLDGRVAPMAADGRDARLARRLDVRAIRENRVANARELLDGLRGIDEVTPVFPEVSVRDCPLFVPVVLDGRDSLRKYLIAHDVYCPVHWPVSGVHPPGSGSSELYRDGLSLVCDQRYGTEDMRRTIGLIGKWEKTDCRRTAWTAPTSGTP